MNNNPEWNESCYFNFYDERNDLAVLMRVGNKPNKDEKTMFLIVISKTFTGAMRFATKFDKDDMWSCANLAFKEGKGSWKITYNGPVFDPMDKEKRPHMLSMDVDWSAVNPLMDYRDCVDAKGTELSSKVASEHYEQFGKVTGSFVLDGESFSIAAEGERDRSSGVREWTSPKMWMWFNSTYCGKYGFNMTKLDTGMGEVDAGYFFEDVNHPINNVKADVEFQGPIPIAYRLEMHTKDGKGYAVTAKTILKFVMPTGIGDTALVETVTETEWNGKKGFGIAEMLVHLGK